MEIHDALEFCLRRLQAEPERLLRLARSLAAPAEGQAGASSPLLHPGAEAETNRAVLQISQEVLAETIIRLSHDNS
ncbi:MAG TPA: hypothetical protein VNR89_18935 [Roseomonas sp.]|nr:hypothetical protein [Roseomonas sp.]